MGSTSENKQKSLRMHEETITPSCLRLIKELSSLSFVSNYHLVGGTALALQLGHRNSIDLDFFTTKENIDAYELKSIVSTFSTYKEESVNQRYLKFSLNNVKVEFIYYAYPPHYPLVKWNGINMLSTLDIGLFKLIAILGRNTKKDIVDLYFIDKLVMPLEKVFKLFTELYDKGDVVFFKNIEQLFDDEKIELSKMPEMLMPINFDEALETVRSKILKGVKEELGI